MGIFDTPFNTSINELTSNNFSDSHLQEMQLQLEKMKQQQNSNSTSSASNNLGGTFGKLQNFIQQTDVKKVNFANESQDVIKAYNEMKDVFVLFLLENARPQFEEWCNQRGINVIDNYANSFIAKTNEYIDPKTEQEQEIEKLKTQLNTLLAQINNKEVI